MKIAQVCPYDFSRPGGVKTHISSLSKYLERLGHSVKIIAPDNNGKIEEENVFRFGRNRSLPVGGTKIDINVALGDERKQLKSFLQAENFDVIHYHTFWNPILPLQIRMMSKGVTQVATFHDTPKHKWVGETIMPMAAVGVFKLLDGVISVSQTQAGYLSKFSSRPITVLPNGIDMEPYRDFHFAPRKDDMMQLLFLGRLEPRKGLFFALKAFKALKETFPKLRLIIAGDGDEREAAEQFVADHFLPDVVFKGFVSEQEKLELLKSSDLYIAPAIFGESFGIVLLEAMAAGTAIAGFGNEGYLNVITNDMKPFFPEPEDQEGLINAIESLITSSTKREQMIAAGYERVKAFDWQHLAGEVLKVYG